MIFKGPRAGIMTELEQRSAQYFPGNEFEKQRRQFEHGARDGYAVAVKDLDEILEYADMVIHGSTNKEHVEHWRTLLRAKSIDGNW